MVLFNSLTGFEIDDVLLSLVIWTVDKDVVLSQCQIRECEVPDECELVIHISTKVLDIEVRLSLYSSKIDDAFEVHSWVEHPFSLNSGDIGLQI